MFIYHLGFIFCFQDWFIESLCSTGILDSSIRSRSGRRHSNVSFQLQIDSICFNRTACVSKFGLLVKVKISSSGHSLLKNAPLVSRFSLGKKIARKQFAAVVLESAHQTDSRAVIELSTSMNMCVCCKYP